MLAGKFGADDRPDRLQGGLCQIGILARRFKRIQQSAQMMHPDAEVPFLHEPARAVQFPLIIRLGCHARGQCRGQQTAARPVGKETAADHRIQDAGVARQISRQRRCGRGDIYDQIHQWRVRLEQRKYLHAGGQSGQKPIEGDQSLIRV